MVSPSIYLFRQLRVVVDDLRLRHAFGQAVEDHGDFDAGVADAGPSAAHIGLGSDPRHHFLWCHFNLPSGHPEM